LSPKEREVLDTISVNLKVSNKGKAIADLIEELMGTGDHKKTWSTIAHRLDIPTRYMDCGTPPKYKNDGKTPKLNHQRLMEISLMPTAIFSGVGKTQQEADDMASRCAMMYLQNQIGPGNKQKPEDDSDIVIVEVIDGIEQTPQKKTSKTPGNGQIPQNSSNACANTARQSRTTMEKCKHCGTQHERLGPLSKCQAARSECFKCKEKGHYARCCEKDVGPTTTWERDLSRPRTKAELKQFNVPEPGSSVSSLGNWTDSNDSEENMSFASYSEDESGYRSPQKRKMTSPRSAITRPRSAILADKEKIIEQNGYELDKGKSPPQPKIRRCNEMTRPPDGARF
jgi:hypothetical protein